MSNVKSIKKSEPKIDEKPKQTQGQKLLEAMTAKKAAKEALLKGVKSTHVSFDDEGNEQKVGTVTEGEKKRRNEEQVSEKKTKKAKKLKAKKIEETKTDSKQKEAFEYLQLFVNDRKNWKFKKVLQTWILQNLYKMPKSEFDNALEYLKDLQGASREKTKKEAQDRVPKNSIGNNLTGYTNVSNDDFDDFDAEKLLAQVSVTQSNTKQDESEEVRRARLIVDTLL
ncbi:hypothetical protein RMATCC62417_15219 [Rhizopus microsporus]|nr:hypothetical protein RMATCC62417_15219 [Rhizopus microsporus]